MMHKDAFSFEPVVSKFKGADALPFTPSVDYEDGPIHIQDTSEGLQYQIWRARIVADTVYITSATLAETPVMTVRGIEEISLAFDQNGRHLLTYLVNEGVWLYWYDPILQRYAHLLIEVGAISPRITLDDKRTLQRSSSEIILAYVKNNNLYCRSQLDRYQITYLLQEVVGGRLLRIGMNSVYRMQFIFQAQPYGDYSCTVGLNCL